AALDAAAAQGWQVGPGGRLWCSACGPVLTCEIDGHEFTPWRAVLVSIDKFHERHAGTGHAATPAQGHPVVGREYRYCRRCCLHESRPARELTSARPGRGKPTTSPTELLASAGTDADRGVA
ncbi:MAG: hypothetical protein ACRDRP_24765, partial [Pseudonocardiaceae bacterium]